MGVSTRIYKTLLGTYSCTYDTGEPSTLVPTCQDPKPQV